MELGLPVKGEWLVLSSPGTRVPSHGTHFLAQSFAYDLVTADRADGSEGWWPRLVSLRAPGSFAAFGQPVVAPADGVVDVSVDRFGDHRARSSLLGLVLWSVEQFVPRSFMGLGGLVGNHVVVNVGSAWVLMAHLERGSLAVGVGDVVREGDLLGRCGNSGNSTEPHVHVQAMDAVDPYGARPVRMVFRRYSVRATNRSRDLVITGVPKTGEIVCPR
ncbi:MAG: M23 family metallopeptidase [Actinomycetia bacterium]|nr:M23 family metallopeptidase [Actinomycetes bacterium]